MSEEGRITTGRGGRYLITDLDTMAAEADGEQYITAQAAATDVLEIRASDWKYVEAAEWISPAHIYEKEVGRRRTVTVSLYRLGDVRALRDLPGVDWEAVRACQGSAVPAARVRQARPDPRGRRPRLRAGPGRPARRDRLGLELAVLRLLGAGLGANRGPAHRGHRAPGAGRRPRGRLLRGRDHAVPGLGRDHPGGTGAAGAGPRGRPRYRDHRPVRPHRRDRRDRRGHRQEAHGHPGQPGHPISAGARWVHGITDEMVADARPIAKVLPRLRKVTKGRTILAYNAEFDRSVILRDIERAGKKPMHLEPSGGWYCLMEAYADWLGSHRWLRLGGSHRAAGDCESARRVLIEMSRGWAPPSLPARPRPAIPSPGRRPARCWRGPSPRSPVDPPTAPDRPTHETADGPH
ncbi:3'-5' exonuclease [Streptomyces sp. M19]